jgi:hypothetical protein
MIEPLIIIISVLGAVIALLFILASGKTNTVTRDCTGLSRLAVRQIEEFASASDKLFKLGIQRDAKIYEALELAVYNTGSPILLTSDASYPLTSQPGYVESLSDSELAELIAKLRSVPTEARRELHRRSKERRPPRFSSFDEQQFAYLYANNLLDPTEARETLATYLLYIHITTLAEQNPEMINALREI